MASDPGREPEPDQSARGLAQIGFDLARARLGLDRFLRVQIGASGAVDAPPAGHRIRYCGNWGRLSEEPPSRPGRSLHHVNSHDDRGHLISSSSGDDRPRFAVFSVTLGVVASRALVEVQSARWPTLHDCHPRPTPGAVFAGQIGNRDSGMGEFR